MENSNVYDEQCIYWQHVIMQQRVNVSLREKERERDILCTLVMSECREKILPLSHTNDIGSPTYLSPLLIYTKFLLCMLRSLMYFLLTTFLKVHKMKHWKSLVSILYIMRGRTLKIRYIWYKWKLKSNYI